MTALLLVALAGALAVAGGLLCYALVTVEDRVGPPRKRETAAHEVEEAVESERADDEG